MEKTTEESVIIPTAEVDEHDKDIVTDKPISKRQLKLQKRQEEWLTRKAERRWPITNFIFDYNFIVCLYVKTVELM